MKRNNFKIQRGKLLSTERNLILSEAGKISKKSGAFRVALGYPNTYEVGMSNLGFQTIYRLLNQMSQVTCERFFLFGFPPSGGTRTLESNRNIKDFDLIAFSIPFELDYPHVLELLKLSHIPLLTAERKPSSPLLIAGGVAPTLNPEILAPFLDCILIGESEELIGEFMDLYIRLRNERMSREEILYQLAQLKGVYVPQFYQTSYEENGCIRERYIREGIPRTIERRTIDLEKIETFSPVISPYTHFKNTLLIETSRGCIWGCRFCATGYIHQPCRFFKIESILAQVKKYCQNSKHVGLIGAVISDHPNLEDICRQLQSEGFEIGTSSLRVDMTSPNLLKILVDSGLKTLTLAPEVGTDKMWKVLKKNINRESVLKSAGLAREADIQNLKLYFIISLPFEEKSDIDGIIDLIQEVHKIFTGDNGSRKSSRKGERNLRKITLSINPFVPKPHTPFQWCAMNSEKELKEKLGRIEKAIRDLRGIRLEGKSIREAIIQGILSVGNRNVGMGLFYSIEENLNYRQAWKKAGVNINSLIFEPKKADCVFPWDIIDPKVSTDRLRAEYAKAQKAATE
jgi:radical SAM superfamily enzyme YgiQ (UPF0313 family)